MPKRAATPDPPEQRGTRVRAGAEADAPLSPTVAATEPPVGYQEKRPRFALMRTSGTNVDPEHANELKPWQQAHNDKLDAERAAVAAAAPRPWSGMRCPMPQQSGAPAANMLVAAANPNVSTAPIEEAPPSPCGLPRRYFDSMPFPPGSSTQAPSVWTAFEPSDATIYALAMREWFSQLPNGYVPAGWKKPRQ